MARLSTVRCGAEGKPSLNRAFKSHAVDPKPGDLSMARLKLEENQVEGRTHCR